MCQVQEVNNFEKKGMLAVLIAHAIIEYRVYYNYFSISTYLKRIVVFFNDLVILVPIWCIFSPVDVTPGS